MLKFKKILKFYSKSIKKIKIYNKTMKSKKMNTKYKVFYLI